MSSENTSDGSLAHEQQLIQAAERQEFDSDDGSARAPEQAPRSPDTFPGAGSSIGAYRTVRKLGEGGMGAVYEAEQEHPKRPVALKVVRGGAALDEHRIKLFEREVQTLARLKHSHIAAIYEAGHTEDGEHFFAMELVRGVPLMQYARTRQLSMRARLELFCQICEAINYAHQRGVIHRDLKPSNILIDAEGNSKILDFGLAKMTDADVAVTTIVTELGNIQGTLPYMSPEQARGNPDEIDLRSDVYSLGVILYELLTGELPYEVSTTRGLPEAVRVICEAAPRKLSTIIKTLRGDVETIALKALEKEPSRRYQSASALAEDVQRYLSDQPILARPPSAMYQLKKLVARHKAPFGFLAALFVLTVGSSVWMTVLYREAGAERDRALDAEQQSEVRLAETESVTEFLIDILSAVDPGNEGKDVTVREVLDQAAKTIGERFNDKPLIQARLHTTIGKTYEALGKGVAEEHLQRALDIFRRHLGEEHADTLSAINDLGALWGGINRRGLILDWRAEPMLSKALETSRRALGAEHPVTLTSMNHLAWIHLNRKRYDVAEKLFLQALEMRKRVLGEHHRDTLTSMDDLAELYDQLSRHEEAEKLLVQALAGRRQVLGASHPLTLESVNNLGSVYVDQARYEQAYALLVESVENLKRSLGEDHPQTVAAMYCLAKKYHARGRHAEAEPLYLQALEIHKRVNGEEHFTTLVTMNQLANLYRDTGRYRKGEQLYLQALATLSRVLGEEHPRTLRCMSDLAATYCEWRRFDQAEALYLSALETSKHVAGLSDYNTRWQVAYPLSNLYEDRARFEQAESLRMEILDACRRDLGEEHPDTLMAMNILGLVYRNRGSYDQAEPLFLQTLETCKRVLGEAHWLTLLVMSNLGEMYNMSGRHEKAEPLLTQAVAGSRSLPRQAHRTLRTGQNLARHGACLVGLRRYDEAEAALLEAREILKDRHREGVNCLSELGNLYTKLSRYDDAEPLLARVVARARKAKRLGPQHWLTALCLMRHGVCLAEMNRYDEAEAALLEAHEITVSHLGVEHERTAKVVTALVDFYGTWDAAEPGKGYAEKAAEWRARLPDADPDPSKP